MAKAPPKPKRAPKPKSKQTAPAPELFIVGVAASAGGLGALEALLGNVDGDNKAFVILQHGTSQDGKLTDILARATTMRVVGAADGSRLASNCVYVVPAGPDVSVFKGVLQLMEPPPHTGFRLPGDFFFRSLAEDQGQRAIGIVLSGTGSDGTFGLRAIKESGGITFAQQPETAQYDSMPRTAIDSGWVDYVGSSEEIARELGQVIVQPYMAPNGQPRLPVATDQLNKLLSLIRTAFGNDLTYYKPATIERRVERRLALHKLERIDDYIRFVLSHPDELRVLYKDILISVTNFFRDREPFELLRTRIFPRIMENKPPGAPVRIWVPACSTGEEAYSVAICLLEYLGDRAPDFRIQIFGTDVEEGAIQTARRAIYAQNIAQDVSSDRIHRFFVRKESHYQISRRVRDLVVFSTHNVTKDAPFSKLDLVSCRNLLIYLQPTIQKRVLRIMHYALNPGGFLMLGTSETVGELPQLFSLVDRKYKTYVSKPVTSAPLLDVSFGVVHPEPGIAPPMRAAATRPRVNVATLTERKILELFGPPAVVVDDTLEILHFRGRTGLYLEPSPGAASLNILRLARPEIHSELRRTIHQAMHDDERASTQCHITRDGERVSFKLEVVPMADAETKLRCLLVLFHEPVPMPEKAEPHTAPGQPEQSRIEELERDLALTKDYLQSTIEELESANEELKSSNEEMQSSNEELQSTNEELETSKEELQSSNEELTTVNEELQTRMLEQQQTNDDLHNVLHGIELPLLLVGRDLRIRRFSQGAEKLFSLMASDSGRPIAQLDSFFASVRLGQIAADVIETLAPFQREVKTSDGTEFRLRVTPYKTLEHSIAGVMITALPRE